MSLDYCVTYVLDSYKTPPQSVVPAKSAGIPSSFPLCGAAAELTHKKTFTQTSSRKASEHLTRSSAPSRGPNVKSTYWYCLAMIWLGLWI